MPLPQRRKTTSNSVFFSFVYDDFDVSLWVIMGKSLYILVEILTSIVFVFQLFFAIRILQMPSCPRNFKAFYWYPIIGIIVGLIAFFHRLDLIIPVIYSVIVKSSLVFHFTFLSNFIFSSVGKKLSIKILITVCVFILCSIIIRDILIVKNGGGHSFANGLLFLFACYYFYSLMSTSFKINLQNNPDFILCCGVFLGCGLTIPFNIMLRYLAEFNIPKDTIFIYGIFAALGYLIMNLFFLKALLCIKQNT
jgi:hypothetical protein